MRVLRSILFLVCLLIFCAGISVTPAKTDLAAPELELFDLKGNKINPFISTKNKAVVFVFISSACPIANRYAPELQRLQRLYAPKGVGFWLVHADPDETPEAISRNLREHGYKCGALRDPKHDLVKLAKARITPEAALFLPGGQLMYHGRIDNRYEDFGRARPKPTKRELHDAIQAVLAGKPIRVSEAKAVGCYIPSLE